MYAVVTHPENKMAIPSHRRHERTRQNTRETKFIKVVFRQYMDSFSAPEVRGEVDEHLGILGPVIKAEVGQTLTVCLCSGASRAALWAVENVSVRQLEHLDLLLSKY